MAKGHNTRFFFFFFGSSSRCQPGLLSKTQRAAPAAQKAPAPGSWWEPGGSGLVPAPGLAPAFGEELRRAPPAGGEAPGWMAAWSHRRQDAPGVNQLHFPPAPFLESEEDAEAEELRGCSAAPPVPSSAGEVTGAIWGMVLAGKGR